MSCIENCLMHFRAVWGFDIDDELIPRLKTALNKGMTEGDVIAAIDYVAKNGDELDSAGEETLLALGRLYKRRKKHG